MNSKLTKHFSALALATGLLAAPSSQADIVQVTANISGAETWFNTNEYVLNGFIYVLDGASLTIQAGTVVKAKPGQDANTSCLIVTAGGKIFANGSRTQPIIFTAEADDVTIPDDIPIFQRGLWGGVILLGKSVLNTTVDAAGNAASPKYDVFEGLPDTQINGQFVNRFGGNDDNDSSGVLRYVSIRHAGVVFAPNKEINGLSLGAVGRGTTVEYIEMYAAADDGVEFFGGTVNTKYMVSAFNDDDCFDIDQGFRGKNQFWFAIQEPGKKDNGGEWNGEPNGLAASNAPFANFEIYNATWIGAGTNTTANRGLFVREYAAPKLYNSLLTQFGGNALNIDAKSGWHLTNGLLQIRDNFWWNFATNGVPVALGETVPAQYVFANPAWSNAVTDPMLRGIARNANGRLDPRLSDGSPLLSPARIAPDDGFYTPAKYAGAFGTNDLWLTSWTALYSLGFVRPTAQNVIQVTANITGNVQWYRTNEYILNGFIYALDGATLDIEAGTVVGAKPGQDANTSCLIVTAGGKILAKGTQNNPIIFTAEADDVTVPGDIPIFQRGLWGGVILLGKAVLNTTVDAAGNAASPKYDVFEGLPDTQINGQFVNRFGGNNDNDSSGLLRYVSIRHAGVVFAPNKEINGLSLGAVGRGTTVDHIEMYAAADDGVEFFGGTVNTKYMVSAFNDDDCFDIDQGYRGKNQFWFAIQEPGKKDNGGEWNGEPNGLAASNAPIANYEIYNATWIGAGTNTTANRGLFVREYAAPKLYNSLLTQFGGNALNIDAKSGWFLTNGLLQIRDNIWWNFATNGVPVALGETVPAQYVFANAAWNNVVVDPLLRRISRSDSPPFRLDPRPAAGSPALSAARTPPNDGFYCAAPYTGAFQDINWATDWTAISERSILNTAGAGTPICTSGAASCPQPTLYILQNGVNVDLSWVSQSGCTYRVKSSPVLPATVWSNEGAPIPGTGGVLTKSVLVSGDKFFQVEVQ
jgi:trimeric autotransporter adhesin